MLNHEHAKQYNIKFTCSKNEVFMKINENKNNLKLTNLFLNSFEYVTI